jgi:hypothetical protein
VKGLAPRAPRTPTTPSHAFAHLTSHILSPTPASYFDEGIFAGASSGLTYSSTYPISGNLSAYKVHERDLLPFHGGFTLEWRNMESNLCPTHELPPASHAPQRRRASGVGPMTLTALVYSYIWPQAATVGV